MIINLLTPIADQSHSRVLSCLIPEVVKLSSDSSECVTVKLAQKGATVWTADIYPFDYVVKIHTIRQIVEDYSLRNNLPLTDWALSLTQGSSTFTTTFDVIYCGYGIGSNRDNLLADNFLTVGHSQMLSRKATIFLSSYLDREEAEEICTIVYSTDAGGPFSKQVKYRVGDRETTKIYLTELTYVYLQGEVSSLIGLSPDEITIHSVSIFAGSRSFTFYFHNGQPQLALFFRNTFLVWEPIELFAKVTRKASTERSLAVVGYHNSLSEAKNKVTYEAALAPLPIDDALRVEQLLFSSDVRLATERKDYEEESFGTYLPENMPKIFITEFTSEVADEAAKLTSIKFTFQLEDTTAQIPIEPYAATDRVFDDKYQRFFK